MNLAELKESVDNAVEWAKEYGEKPEEIAVTLHITTFLDPKNVQNHETVFSREEIELHYDGNGLASGCVITASKELDQSQASPNEAVVGVLLREHAKLNKLALANSEKGLPQRIKRGYYQDVQTHIAYVIEHFQKELSKPKSN